MNVSFAQSDCRPVPLLPGVFRRDWGTAGAARCDIFGKDNMNKQAPARKSDKKPRPKRVKEVASDKPKPLQEKSSLKEAGEKMRSLRADNLPVASGDHLVGAVEGQYPERKAAGFGHDPETTLVREIMVKEACYCFENQSLDEAREIMRVHRLKYLPVVDENMRVVGVVALSGLGAGEQPRPL
jgi:CBS domain-containing protein